MATRWRDLARESLSPTLCTLQCGVDSLRANVTDLCGWYACTYDRAQLEALLKEEEVDTPLEQLLHIIQACFDEKKPATSYTFNAVHLPEAGVVRLKWTTSTGLELTFSCKVGAKEKMEV